MPVPTRVQRRLGVHSNFDALFRCAEEILHKGSQPGHTLTEEDAELIRVEDVPITARDKLQGAWCKRKALGVPSLSRSILDVGIGSFATGGVLHLAESLVQFVPPMLIKEIVTFIVSGNQDIGGAFLLGVGFVLAPFLQSLLSSNFIGHARGLGIRTVGATSCMVFEKVLCLSPDAAAQYGPGTLVNLLQVDTSRFEHCFFHLNFIWSMPLMLVIGVFLLYLNVGIAAFTPIILMLALHPLNSTVVRRAMNLSREINQARDARVKLLTEAVHAVRLMKMLAWEGEVTELIQSKRDSEMAKIARMKSLDMVSVLIWG